MCFIQYLNCASSGNHTSAEAYILKNVLQGFSLFNMKFFLFIFTFLGKLLSDKIHHFNSTIYMSKPCQMFSPHYCCHTQVSLRLAITSLKTQLIKISTYSSGSHMRCITAYHCYIFWYYLKQTGITALPGSNYCIINTNTLSAQGH
jgi:hypothetical protein